VKIFCSRSSAVVEECRSVFAVPSITDQIHTRKINFLRKFCESDNCLRALFAGNVSRECARQFVDEYSLISIVCWFLCLSVFFSLFYSLLLPFMANKGVYIANFLQTVSVKEFLESVNFSEDMN